MKELFFSLLFFFFVFTPARAHHGGLLSLDERLAAADLVVTARVLDAQPFYNAYGQIDTRHRLLVETTWFGDASIDTLDLVTHGGRINEEMTVVRPALSVKRSERGVFLLRQRPGDQGTDWYPAASQESLLRIDAAGDRIFDQNRTLTNEQMVAKLTGFFNQRPIAHVVPHLNGFNGEARSGMMPNISSFSPTSLSGGTGQILTITGSGFGSSIGQIGFDSPDNGSGGGFTIVPNDAIISWSDTQVEVEVTGEAGTGVVFLRTSGNQTTQSTQTLTVTYAISTLQTTNGLANPRLIDDAADGDGGYVFLLSNSTANNGQSIADNAPAVAALGRAVTTWQNTAGFSFYAGLGCGTTPVQTPIQGDDINVISFDNGAYDLDDLSGGTVGISFSYYSACGSSEFELVGGDIILRREGDPNGIGGDVDWFYGSGTEPNGTVNFEAVVLHEIGHTFQLNHVNDPDEVMNFQVLSGQANTNLSADDIAASNYINGISVAYSPPVINCGGDFNEARPYAEYDPGEDCINNPLPVEWVSFIGRTNGAINELFWTTGMELNSDYFNVQRSSDGRTFASIGRVDAAGNSSLTSNYAFTDRSPIPGVNYYRLAQVDFDGTTDFSEVVRLTNEVATSASVAVAPNPFNEQLTLNSLPAGITHVRLYTTHGELVSTWVRQAGQSQMDLSTDRLPSGIYWLVVGEEVLRIIKQ